MAYEARFCLTQPKNYSLINDSRISFDCKSVHNINAFNAKILDLWWITPLKFKIYSRILNQRQPCSLGEASIPLKYLLINDNLRDLKIPVFASSAFRNVKRPEIIGDLFLSFYFNSNSRVEHEYENVADEEISTKTKNIRKINTENRPQIPIPKQIDEGTTKTRFFLLYIIYISSCKMISI